MARDGLSFEKTQAMSNSILPEVAYDLKSRKQIACSDLCAHLENTRIGERMIMGFCLAVITSLALKTLLLPSRFRTGLQDLSKQAAVGLADMSLSSMSSWVS